MEGNKPHSLYIPAPYFLVLALISKLQMVNSQDTLQRIRMSLECSLEESIWREKQMRV